MLKKIDRARETIRKHCHLFMCPLCGAAMKLNETGSLMCEQRHCFDLSKNGYIHLLSRPVKPGKYDHKLFESRQAICRSGFFDELIRQLSQIVKSMSAHPERLTILDVGCGEGSHLAGVVNQLGASGAEVLGVGMDLSKDAIHIASRDNPGLIWCVADLARSPFADKQFDVILNIFSPANYSQFARMLADDGIVIKVVPGNDYLKELRRVFYGQTDEQLYSNEEVVTHFRKHFQRTHTRQIHYRQQLDSAGLKHLIQMTPLAWGTTEEKVQRALQSGIASVTIDVTVVVGKK